MLFSEMLNAIGLLEAKFVFFKIPLEIVFCFKILKVCLDNENVLFNTFLTIFEWCLYDKHAKSNHNFTFSCQTFKTEFRSIFIESILGYINQENKKMNRWFYPKEKAIGIHLQPLSRFLFLFLFPGIHLGQTKFKFAF